MDQQVIPKPQDEEVLPQLIGDYQPVDRWQAHINDLFYRLRGDQLQKFYQTFATADYRLAHALASDYHERALKREASHVTRDAGSEQDPGGSDSTRTPPRDPRLTILEWGPGNGNLAACFLSHLKKLDREGTIYPRVRYVLVDAQQGILDVARAHPDLAAHGDRIEVLCADAGRLESVQDGTVDRIVCNELWNDLSTKLMVRKGADIEEEYIRPNLSERLYAAIQDWSGFLRAFEAKDVATLKTFPSFLDDLVWEKEYRKVAWKGVPYRKTITEFIKRIDEEVLTPVNLGAFATLKEAKRLLSPHSLGFSSFDAGTDDMGVLNSPDKPCSGQFGGQYSFMINFALIQSVAKHLGLTGSIIEPQREFIGQTLGTNVITLMDLLASHPSAGKKLEQWQQEQLTIRTIHALDEHYVSPYRRTLNFPLHDGTPQAERDSLEQTLAGLKPTGIPDTIAYVTEEEVTHAMPALEQLGYERETIMLGFRMPPSPIDYHHFRFSG